MIDGRSGAKLLPQAGHTRRQGAQRMVFEPQDHPIDQKERLTGTRLLCRTVLLGKLSILFPHEHLFMHNFLAGFIITGKPVMLK